MKDDVQDQRRVFGWALPGSLAAHALVALLLIFGLPLPFFEAEAEKAIEVDLVPPKPPEKPKAEPPPPQEKPEKPEGKKGEKPPEGNDAARPATQPVLKPVFQFGEKDAGPRQAPDGNSAEDGSASPEPERKPDKQELAQPPARAATESKNPDTQPLAQETPTPKPTPPGKEQEASKPKEAKRLFSQSATGDVLAMTAMGNLPRGVRAGRLCVTELREQLQNGLPPYYPDLLPSSRLEEGTVIDVPEAAFRMNGEWYDLGYRCEVDTDATKVVGFALRVGDLLPPSEWRRRGLPLR